MRSQRQGATGKLSKCPAATIEFDLVDIGREPSDCIQVGTAPFAALPNFAIRRQGGINARKATILGK